jgi:membrane protein DedA with SNARE-associated domain
MELYVLEFINNILDKNVIFVYFFFFISNVLQLVFPPFPSDVILFFQGYISTINNKYDFFLIYINAMAGTMLGSYLVFKLGYLKGDSVFKYKMINKFFHVKHRYRAEQLFNKYGFYAIIFSKFVPATNAIMILLAGVFKVKPRVVYLSVFISILVQHALILMLGRLFGNNVDNVKKIIRTYNIFLLLILTLCLIIGISFWFFKKYNTKKYTDNEK